MVGRRLNRDRLVEMRIKLFTDSDDRLDAHGREDIVYLMVNECDAVDEGFDPLTFLVRHTLSEIHGSIEVIEHRQHLGRKIFHLHRKTLVPFSLGPIFKVFKILGLSL